MFDQEGGLWARPTGIVSLILGQKQRGISCPELEIGVSLQEIIVRTSKDFPYRAKDFEIMPISVPATLPFCLQFSEQKVLREIQNVLRYSPVTEFQLPIRPSLYPAQVHLNRVNKLRRRLRGGKYQIYTP